MAFHEPLVALLKADTRIYAITDRIYPNTADPGTARPYIVYKVSIHEHGHSHGGPTGLAFGMFMAACWAEFYDGAWSLADEVRRVLNGLAKGTHGGIDYEGIILKGSVDGPDPAVNGGSKDTSGVLLRFLVQYRES